VGEDHVCDSEILFRRIPPGSPWFEPPDRIASFNFKLKPQEAGLSVYRERIVSGLEVLEKPQSIPGSMLAWATAGEIRALTNAAGKPLHLDVVAVADEHDPGHAEIRGPESGRLSTSAAKALKKLFRLTGHFGRTAKA
jgi:hypothetical protein